MLGVLSRRRQLLRKSSLSSNLGFWITLPPASDFYRPSPIGLGQSAEILNSMNWVAVNAYAVEKDCIATREAQAPWWCPCVFPSRCCRRAALIR